jgi:hypothetical protein
VNAERTRSDLLPHWPFTFSVCQLLAFSNTFLFAHSLTLSNSISYTVFFPVRHFVKLFDRLCFVMAISGSSSWHQEAQIDHRHKNWIPKGRCMPATPHCFIYQFCSYYTCAKKKDDFQTDISYFCSICFLIRNGNAPRKSTLNITPIIFHTVRNETNRTLKRRRWLQLLGGLVIAPLIHIYNSYQGNRSFLPEKGRNFFFFLSIPY